MIGSTNANSAAIRAETDAIVSNDGTITGGEVQSMRMQEAWS